LNAGDAKSEDVIKIIEMIKKSVFENFNIVLLEEIEYL